MTLQIITNTPKRSNSSGFDLFLSYYLHTLLYRYLRVYECSNYYNSSALILVYRVRYGLRKYLSPTNRTMCPHLEKATVYYAVNRAKETKICLVPSL